jgi:O-methyltransferase involved in polyketide biosynthesis
MKITKQNLKQLIAEEYAKIMNEEPVEETVEETVEEGAEEMHAVRSADQQLMTHGAQISAIAKFLEPQGFRLPLADRNEE